MIIESPVKGYYVNSLNADIQINKIRSDHNSVFDFFRHKYLKFARNLRYLKNMHWTQDEIDEIHRQDREAVCFPEIERVIRNIMGTEAQMRMDAKAAPREFGDQEQSDILSAGIKFNDQVNDIEYLQSDVFRISLVGGVGISSTRWEYENLDIGYAVHELVPPYEVMWDTNSIKRDLSDARWMLRRQWLTKLDLLERFPGKHSLIEKAATRFGHSDDIFWDSVTCYDETSRQGGPGWHTGYYWERPDERAMFPVTEYYERLMSYSYIVEDLKLGTKVPFPTMKKARSYYKGIIKGYRDAGELTMDDFGNSLITLARINKEIIQQTIMVGDIIIEQELSTMPAPPFTMSFANFVLGDFWGHIDGLIDKQDIINRSWGMQDYLLGTSIKGGYLVIKSFLDESYQRDPEKLIEDASQPTPYIFANNSNALQPIAPNLIPPQYLQNMNFMISKMTDDAGGNTMFGIQENAQESAAAIEARARQGGIGRLEFFDNLKFWRKQIELKVAWYLKNFLSPAQWRRIIGTYSNLNSDEIDDNVLETLEELKVDVVIEEAIKSDTMNERILKQFTDIAIATKMSPEMTLPFMLKLSSLPAAIKDEMLNLIPFYQEYMEKQAEAARIQKYNTQVEASIYKEQRRTQMQADEV